MIYYACIVFFMMTMQDHVTVTATIYQAVEGQTDSTPNLSAIMFEIDLDDPRKHNIIAVSRDLEGLGFEMGEYVLVEGAGELSGVWVIEDRMNKRWVHRIDFLVNNDIRLGKWNDVKLEIWRQKKN